MPPFAARAARLGTPSGARTPVRLATPERISRQTADAIRDELREFAHLGGFAFRPDSTPWFGAALRTPEDAAPLRTRACCPGGMRTRPGGRTPAARPGSRPRSGG